MNISTLAKILGVSISELRELGTKHGLPGFFGRNTRIPYQSARKITEILRPEKLAKLENDDKIYIPASLKVQEFADSIGKPVSLVVKTLLLNGIIATLNEKIDFDTASLIAQELGVEVYPEDENMFQQENTETLGVVKVFDTDTSDQSKTYVPRGPVVTVMGHVDHGKTTLLDTIRKTEVALREAGGITQHIYTYKITYKPENSEVLDTNKTYQITFVDTPGHEAFTAMRARGSQLADFIILVVSAVEGPKPQTVEVIERAKLTKTPVVVAINKIDLPDADIERTTQEISKYGLIPEEWGGNTPFVPISARNNLNIDKLLETILLQAELLELKGEINCPGQAVVIESNLDPKVGVMTTALVVKDQLKVGDIVRCGEYVGKIRKLTSTTGEILQAAAIGDPVVIVGLPEIVSTGERIIVYSSQKEAQNDANLEIAKKAQKQIINYGNKVAYDNQINLVLKADVLGSLEALKESILKIPQEKVRLAVKWEGVGQVTEKDVHFAKTANATILAFNTSLYTGVENLIKREKVTVVQSPIIYELLEWVEAQILANTKHEIKEISLGKAEILALFKSDKVNQQIVGGRVLEGKIVSNKMLKIIRQDKVVGKAEIVELQRNRVKVSEVQIAQEFGVSLISKVKVQKGDIVESFDEILVK